MRLALPWRRRQRSRSQRQRPPVAASHRIRSFLVPLCLVLLTALFSVRTFRRNVDWQDEEKLYKSGIPINPPKSYGNLGNVYSSQGRLNEAEWAYRRALLYRSNMADVHYNLGVLLQNQERNEEALECYRMAIKCRPRFALAHLNLGLVLTKLGHHEEASTVFISCSELDGSGLKDQRTHESTRISALFQLGHLKAEQGHYEEAIEVYLDAVRQMPSYYQPQSLYNLLGEAYYRLDRFDDAERWYKAALEVKPDHVPAHLTYGKMLARNKTRIVEAEMWFRRAKELAPNDTSVYQHFGQFLSELNRHEEAARNYIRAVELQPDKYETVFNTANALRQAGQHQMAENYYQMAVRLKPHDPRSHMNLGAMLHLNGKYREAEESYLESLRLKPNEETTLINLMKLRNLLLKLGLTPTTTHLPGLNRTVAHSTPTVMDDRLARRGSETRRPMRDRESGGRTATAANDTPPTSPNHL